MNAYWNRILFYVVLLLWSAWGFYRVCQQLQQHHRIARQGIPTQGRLMRYDHSNKTSGIRLRGSKMVYVEYEHQGQRYQCELEGIVTGNIGKVGDPIEIIVAPTQVQKAVLDMPFYQLPYLLYLLILGIAALFFLISLIRILH